MSDLELPIIVQPTASTAAESSQPKTNRRFAWIDFWMIVLMLIWGSNLVLLKSALETLSPFVLNAIRFSAATMLLGLVFRAQGVQLTMPRREWGVIILLAFIGQVVYQGVFLYALHLTTVANNALIMTTVPVWVVLFNAWKGHEHLSRRGMTGVFVALFGVATVIMGGDTVAIGANTLPGDLLSLVAAFIWVAAMLMMRAPLQRNPSLPVAFWTVAWAALFQWLFAVPDLIRLNWQLFQPSLIMAVLYSGFVSIGIGQVIWNIGVQKLGTGRPAVYTYLEPVIGGVTAAIVLHEPLTLWLIIGGILVMLGVVFVKSG